MNATTNTSQITETAELLAAGTQDTYEVTITTQGWIDLKVNPDRQLDPNAKLDFLRVVQEDDSYFRLIHLTHNEVLKGEATFSNSFVGALYGAIHTFFETL